MAYCELADLLIGDITLGSAIDPQKVIDDAAREMDSRIGMIYNLPLPPPGTIMPAYVDSLLTLINSRVASGRLLMQAASASQSRELNAYGKSLVDDGYADLAKILDGSILLDGATRRPDGTQALGPSVINRDAVSATDAFEEYFFPPAPYYPPYRPPLAQPVWKPGPPTPPGPLPSP